MQETKITIDDLTGFRRYAERETQNGKTPAHYTLTGRDNHGGKFTVTINDTEAFEERTGVPADATLEKMLSDHETIVDGLKKALRTLRGRMAANTDPTQDSNEETASETGTEDAQARAPTEIVV